MDARTRAVLVPWYPDLLSGIGLWLLKIMGRLQPDTLILPDQCPDKDKIEEFGSAGIYSLCGKKFMAELKPERCQFKTDRDGINTIRALIHYASVTRDLRKIPDIFSKTGWNPGLLRQFLSCFSSNVSPRTSYLQAVGLIEQYFAARIDPRSRNLDVELPSPTPASFPLLPETDKNRILVSIPQMDGLGPDAAIIGTRRITLNEERIRILQHNQVKLAVCGPPGVGKSTMVATLASEIHDLIDSLKTRTDFADLAVRVAALDLDLGTPTLDRIHKHLGTDRQAHQSTKKPWDIELVYPAIRQLAELTENLLIIDLPGKIDAITALLLSAADCAIITTDKWDGINQWRKVLSSFGVVCLSESRSHPLPSEECSESLVRRYTVGEFLSGRFVGAKRQMRNWDSYVQFLARVMLFDLLPEFIIKRQAKLGSILEIVTKLQ